MENSSLPPTAKLARSLLRDRAYEAIREAILQGVLRPGERIDDRALQTWLGVSRTPIREALNALDRDGLVEMPTARLTRVVAPRPSDVEELLCARGALACGFVMLAVPHMSRTVRQRIVRQIGVVVDAVDDADLERAATAMEALLAYYLEAADNKQLTRLIAGQLVSLDYRLRVAAREYEIDWADARSALVELRASTIGADGRAAAGAIGDLHGLLKVGREPPWRGGQA